MKGSDLLAEELLFKIRCLSNVMQSTSWNFTFLPTQHLKLLPLEPTALTPADFKGRGTGPSVPSTLLCPTYVFNSMLVKLGRAFISINSEQQRGSPKHRESLLLNYFNHYHYTAICPDVRSLNTVPCFRREACCK